MSLGTILLIILILALVGVIPAWPHSRSWRYGPSGGPPRWSNDQQVRQHNFPWVYNPYFKSIEQGKT